MPAHSYLSGILLWGRKEREDLVAHAETKSPINVIPPTGNQGLEALIHMPLSD